MTDSLKAPKMVALMVHRLGSETALTMGKKKASLKASLTDETKASLTDKKKVRMTEFAMCWG